MRRGEVRWASLPEPFGRRPVVIVTRTSALDHLASVLVAPVTSTVREIPSEVSVGRDEGLAEGSIVNCDQIALIPRRLIDRDVAGALGPRRIVELDRALRFASGIVF